VKTFFDTSALVKNYIEEEGSLEVTDLIFKSHEIYVSPVTKIEFFSTLNRLFNTNKLNLESYKIAEKEFITDIINFTVIDFNQALSNLAIESVRKFSLKTLDSIQLSSAIHSNSHCFVTSDKKLYEVSKSSLTDCECVFI
jgi:predicted nucleic acid-binding protein